MAKLYVFGIGGTGSRVIKALSFLMATGMDLGYDLVPIIIDPDVANGDLTRTVEILKNYQRIRDKHPNSEGFFKTRITNEGITNDFTLKLGAGIADERFGGYIDRNTLEKSDKALINALFSNSNLDTKMGIGFTGNPNIGSVILNQFNQNPDYEKFASSFGAGDRIFIISSIFGGTGAAGFPLILKNLREAPSSLANAVALQNSVIGAITILPYFSLIPDADSPIDSSTFISKTKAALQYYDKNVNASVNALYYLADSHTKPSNNEPGAAAQKNDAHFIELAAAMAVIDFACNTDLLTENGVPQNPEYKEFGVAADQATLTCKDLEKGDRFQLRCKLAQYTLFQLYLKNQIADSLGQDWATKSPKIDSHFSHSSWFANLTTFNNLFEEWLNEMAANTRSFTPFNLEVSNADLFNFVNGEKPKSKLFEKGTGYSRVDTILNDLSNKHGEGTAEQRFLNLFSVTCNKLITDKYNF